MQPVFLKTKLTEAVFSALLFAAMPEFVEKVPCHGTFRTKD